MKKSTLILMVLSSLVLYSCFGIFNDVEPEIFEDHKAVIISRTEFENSTALLESQPIIETGKIYVKGKFLFINQPNKGFHVFDNSNPESPVNMAFLKVLGSTDLSIRNDILYINNARDLIAVKPNFTDKTISITKRIVNTFPELEAPNNCCYELTNDDEVIIDWILKE